MISYFWILIAERHVTFSAQPGYNQGGDFAIYKCHGPFHIVLVPIHNSPSAVLSEAQVNITLAQVVVALAVML